MQAGRRTTAFGSEERLSEFHVVGEELIVRTHERFVRLRPGQPKPVGDLKALLTKPELSPEERRSIVYLGKRALPAILDEIAVAHKERQRALAEMMFSVADRFDTPAVLALSQKLGPKGLDTYPITLKSGSPRWLTHPWSRTPPCPS